MLLFVLSAALAIYVTFSKKKQKPIEKEIDFVELEQQKGRDGDDDDDDDDDEEENESIIKDATVITKGDIEDDGNVARRKKH